VEGIVRALSKRMRGLGIGNLTIGGFMVLVVDSTGLKTYNTTIMSTRVLADRGCDTRDNLTT